MGCASGRDDEQPEHRVAVDGFEMAVFQVRNQDWKVFTEATGHPAPPYWSDPNFSNPDFPVVAVNWIEAEKYCEWLTRSTGRRYRLPTEAEWEWAARGGREGELYPWGDDPPETRPDYLARWSGVVNGPRRVGESDPNPFGVFDLCENVHEWCADWYDKAAYARFAESDGAEPARNPQGPAEGTRRASRGGSWRHHIKVSRCAARSSIPPTFQYADYGFRVVRDFEPRHGPVIQP